MPSLRKSESVAFQQEAEKVAQLAEIIRTYRGLEAEEEEHLDLHWCDKPWFDVFMCFVIFMNVVVIGLEMDHGDDNKSGYARDGLWIALEWIFAIIFVGEVGVKVNYHSLKWIKKDSWSLLALFIAFMAFLDVAVLSPLNVQGLRMFAICRCVYFLRLKRVIEAYTCLKELKLVIRGMVGSWASIAWSVACLVLIIYVYAVWTTTLIGFREGNDEMKIYSSGWDNQDLFGSMGRSMYTLIQVVTLDDWCTGIVRYVAVEQWYMIYFFLSFLSLTTYGIMNVIVSIIVEQTLETSSRSETRKGASEARQQKEQIDSIREVFMLCDADSNGDLTMLEFTEGVAEDTEVQWRLRQLELPQEDVTRLFQVIDGDGCRTLSLQEFMDGCTKLKGNAKSRDLLALQQQAYNMAEKMDKLGYELRGSELMLSRLDDCTRRMTSRYGPTVLDSRRGIAERVRGAAPLIPLPPEKAGEHHDGHLAAGNMPRLPNFPDLVR